MSNKIALATIQFKADARGANAALESLRQESKTSHEEIDKLNKALQDGIKTMKDANGIEFDVAKRLKEARTEANSFDKAINELIKGATALESVVKNIRLGEIEKSSRAELVGAINAVNARRRSLKEEMPNYDEIKKDLADVENEARKQLNRLDHDTERLLQTLREGGAVAKSVIDEEVDGLNKLLRLIPETDAEWKKYNDQLKEIETHVTNIRKEELKQTAGIIDEKNLGQFSETQIRAAIDATRELMKTVETGGSEYKRFAENIVNAENHLKQYGVEAERARQKEAAADDALKQKEQELSTTMRNRLQSLKALSADALAETKRYWEAQARGADQGTAALKKAEDALKQIDNLERKRKVAALDEILGDPSKHGVAEVRNAVHEFEKLRDSVQKGIPAWQHYNKMVKQGQAYLDNLAKAEAAQRIEAQMRNLSTLSSQGMAEVKKYWEAMVLGAAKGSTELDTYKAKLDQVIAEEKKRSSEAAQQRVGILGGGNLGQYSEAEIRQAIEAGNQLIKTYQTASPEAKALAQNIVRAEEHLKQYGVEAERAAQREAKAVAEATRKRMEADRLMQNQLKQGTALTESALKTQEQYWRKLIDDPKTASASLKQYESNLAEVKRLQEQMAADKGEAALAFFRGDTSNASGSQIEEQAKALKAYRDSLPRQAEAATINEINGYLQQAGVAAEKAAEQTMTLKQALQVSAKAGSGEFKGTTEQLNLARKTLEEMQKGTVKGGYAWRRLQEAITRVDLELKNTGKISKEVEAILDHPKGKSFNELKMAIEQGRLALQNMRTETQQDQKQFDELSAKIKEADFQLKALGNSSKGTASAFDKAWSRLKTYVGLYMGAAVAIRKVVSTMGDLMELSDRMGEVRKTTGFTADEVGRLSEELAKMDTRTALKELMGLSVAAGQLGLKTEEDVRGFTEAANMLMVALPEMGQEGATAMLKVALATGEIDKIRKQMQEGLVEGNDAVSVAMTKIGSTIDALRANSAAAAPAITDFVKRVGAVGAQSGITIDQVAALGSTVDALGMRVEMSATALSRMIPAIKNNAFELSQAIHVAPQTLRNLFETGRGMEAVLMILQHIKDSGMDADSVEKMLGMGGMQDIMKDLNQMGARAGIVFAGLSQNVDELRRQLGIAKTAYEENIAIQNEYNKMNETTAAKWARLKNEFEEMFVSDNVQKALGNLIELLRYLVNFISGRVNPALNVLSIILKTMVAALGAFKLGLGEGLFVKSIDGIKNFGKAVKASTIQIKNYTAAQWALVTAHTAEEKAAAKAAVAQAGLNKAMAANVFLALAAAVWYAITAFKNYREKAMEAARETARFEAELQKEQAKVEDLTNAAGKASVKVDDAKKKVKEASRALDEAKKSADGSKESTEKLTKAETDLIGAEEELRRAQDEHSRSIETINSQYGQYLGFLLSEVSSDNELAAARQLINDKLREGITLRKKEAQLNRIEEKKGESRDKAYAKLSDYVTKNIGTRFNNGTWTQNPKVAARIMTDITKAAQKDYENEQEFVNVVYKILSEAGLTGEGEDAFKSNVAADATLYYRRLQDIRKDIKDIEAQNAGEEAANREQSQKDLKLQYELAIENYSKLETDYANARGKAKKKAAADLLKQMDTIEEMVSNSRNYYDLEDAQEKASYNAFVRNSEERVKGMRDVRKALLKEAGDAYKSRTTVGGGRTTATDVNPGGKKLPAESTEYAEWTVEQLVNRRKMMRDFRNAIKTDTDVKAVLAEDAALMEAFKDKNADMRSVIKWYNTERLKIQDELRGRYSTNTGDWLDAGGSKRGRKFDESTYVLAELERYYALRKERIEDARIEEGLTEAEYNRRIEALEQEHLQKRSDLRKTFTEKDDKAFVKQFRQWWADIEELDEIRWDKVDKEWSKATDRSIRFNDMNAQKDLAKMKGVIMKQMNEIANIISKERPFDGITKNLEDNLTKMSILFTDKERTDRQLFGVEDFVRQRTERLQFLLKEAEHAYSIGSEELLGRMREAGLNNWADAIASDENADAMKQALMAQLRAAYDAVQEAIKKEATLIKKQVEIQWNDTVLTNGQSMKQAFEGILSSLGLQEDRVNRANSLVGGGTFSERVADRLAIKQMQVRLQMQETYYAMLEKIGKERIEQLEKAGKLEDALHVRKSRDLALSEEQKKKDEQRVAIANRLEESQNRLYKELREWSELLASSLQGVFEATNAGNAEYYNELAKLSLTGKGGPGAGTYVVIDNAGTSEAKAHYEYLSERDALERQHEIERQNAVADAWKKVMDDINEKMSESITDQLNAMMQNSALTDNTTSVEANTLALGALTVQLAQGLNVNITTTSGGSPAQPPQNTSAQGGSVSPVFLPGNESGFVTEWQQGADAAVASAEVQTSAARKVEEALQRQFRSTVTTTTNANKEIEASTHSMFAKMTQAANLYGIAYQAMSNSNLSTTQKFEMMALQAVGNYAISSLTAKMAAATAGAATDTLGVFGKLWSMLGPAATPVFAIFTGLLGGLMGLAANAITKSKSEIVQATGASNNVGRLATGMLTYGEGNVNEFTDPRTLTTGRRYNVQAADGKTYRARYMGRNPRTHLTNGPEFHLVGEKGREAIIDAQTTRQITMDDNGIWQAIQTLYNGGRMRRTSIRRARGVASFADGNIESFDDFDGGLSPNGSPMDMAAIMSALDRSSAIQEALLERLSQPFEAFVSPYGKKGIVHGYDHYKKEAKRYGQEYID